MVKAPEGTYTDVFGQMRTNDRLVDLRRDVRRMRRIRSGEIFLELLRGSTVKCALYSVLTQETVGEAAEIHALSTTVTVPIENLDEITMDVELKEALKNLCISVRMR